MSRQVRVIAGATLTLSLMLATSAAGAALSPQSAGRLHPIGYEPITKKVAPTPVSPITYHGGPLLTGSLRLYEIWYGNWSSPVASARQSIFNRFVDGVGTSSYASVLAGYVDHAHVGATAKVALMSSVIDNYSQGKRLSDSSIGTIVNHLVSSGVVPSDPAGTYLVLTSADVGEASGFGQRYCAWHGTTNIGGHVVTTGFLGDPSRRLGTCGTGQRRLATGDRGADAMVANGSHVLFDLATNPFGTGWHDARGLEAGSRCVGHYPISTGTHANPGDATLTSGKQQNHYWLQETWVNVAPLGCAMSVGVSPAHRGSVEHSSPSR